MTIRVQQQPFDVGHELNRFMMGFDGIGAVVNFVGMVRSQPEDDPIEKLVIEHYPGMTESSILRIVDAAKRRWQFEHSLVIHRYGELFPREAIMMVAVQTAHREAAFDAAKFLMDFLKSRAAFWKKEYRNGVAEWVHHRAEDDRAIKKWSQ